MIRLRIPAVLAALALAWQPSAWAQPAPPTEAASPAPIPLGKLPDTIKPLAYRLDLKLDPGQERFSGKAEIDTQLARPSDSIFLHGRDLGMRRASAWAGGQEFIGEWRQADATGVAVLKFPVALPAGPVVLSFEYDGAYNNGPAGLFRVKVGDAWYGWSQFQSIDARAAFPGFDEPGFKTPFTVTLRTPPGHMAVSNAPLVSKALESELEVHRFAPTLPLPTYLLAIMSGPFASVASQVPPTPQRPAPLDLRIISAQTNAGQLSFALEGSKPIVTHLEDYFGEAFPFPKLDQISTPILPGAMENAGADLYNDAILIMDNKASVSRQRLFAMVVAHELAHQWFGDLVTPAWWDDIWLNESFANWMGFYIADKARPDLRYGSGGRAEGFAAMNTDALLAGRPIRQPIITNSQIDSAFDAITYGKGGHVVAMIAAYMGDDKFRSGVRRYMAKHRMANATSDDFFAAMAEEAGDQRLLAAMRSFIDQQGVPLLTFTRKDGGYEVVQSRYAALGTTAQSQQWIIPLCARRESERHCQLLDAPSQRFALKGKGPLIPNAEGTGYYRFELPRADWDALIRMADRLPSGEAMAVADSLGASFRAGRADTRQILALARKLMRNPSSNASESAGTLLNVLTSAQLIDDRATPAYRSFLSGLYRPVIRKLGFDPRLGAHAKDETEIAQQRNEAIGRLISVSRDRGLRRQLGLAANAWLAGDKAALDPQWFDHAFDAHLEQGALPAARALGERALSSQDAGFRPAALDALAGSGNIEIAKWLLNDWKDERLRVSEQRELLRGVLAIRATRETGYRWMRDHLDELVSGSNGIFFTARLPQILNGFCGVEKAREFERDLRPRFASKSGQLELERTIERVRNCGLLNEARAVEVSAEIGQY